MNQVPLRLIVASAIAVCAFPGAVPAMVDATECNGTGSADVPYLPHVRGEPRIDGVADDDYWNLGLTIPIDVETRPGENVGAPVDGHAVLAENGETLFVAFRAADPRPDEIRAYYRDRDSAWADDFVGVVLDTFNNERQAYEFFANALGAQMDLTINDVTDNEDDSWDAIWDSAGRITDTGFEVEMAIPLQQLRFPVTTGPQTWGIDVLRFYPRSKRHRLSNTAQDREVNCYLCQLPKIQGLACAQPGRNLVIAPSMTATRSETRDDPATDPFSGGDTDLEPSLDARWGVTPDLTVIGTINPDFSQVEADVAQLDVNNTFTLFFPEKRPFFLDGADSFDSPTRVVFSRTVADPDYGAKALLKRGANDLAAFVARDARTNLLFPGPEGSDTETLAQDNTTLVARYRRDIAGQSAIGAIVTDREGDDYRNRVVGVDGKLRFDDSNTLQFQHLVSQTEYPQAIVDDFDQPDGEFTGQASVASYRYSTRAWTLRAAYENFDKDFRADNGFITRVDATRWIAGAERTWYPESGAFHRVVFGGDWDINHRDDDTLQEKEWEGYVYIEGPMQSEFELNGGYRNRAYDGAFFREDFLGLYTEFQPFGGSEFGVYLETGDRIDFANTRLGKRRVINPRITTQIGRNLQLRLRHDYSRLDTTGGERIFEANLTDARLTWQFNNRSFLRLVVQHRDTKRNVDLYVDDDVEGRDRSLATQLLYSYKVNPQTVFFLGYSDAAEDDTGLDAFTKTDRTVFAKIGYAWLP